MERFVPNQKIEVVHATNEFRNWQRLLELLQAAFKYQEHRIDPPSSVYALDVKSLMQKVQHERLILARTHSDVAGCVFAENQAACVYVSKLAVWPHLQGQGIGRLLMRGVEDYAYDAGKTVLELNTRIELTEIVEPSRGSASPR